MTDLDDNGRKPSARKLSRTDRLAEALRVNLKRRKAVERAKTRAQPSTEAEAEEKPVDQDGSD